MSKASKSTVPVESVSHKHEASNQKLVAHCLLGHNGGSTVNILRFPGKQSVSKKNVVTNRYNECFLVCKDENKLSKDKISSRKNAVA